MPILDVTPGKWLKVCRVRRIGSDCTSGDECSRSVAIQIDTADLVSQIATLRRPRALLPAIIGCDLFAAHKTVRDASPACLLPLPACCHQLPPPAIPAADACFATLGPRSLEFGGHPGEGSDLSVLGRFGRSLEHEAASFHTWQKSPMVQRPMGAMNGVTPTLAVCSDLSFLDSYRLPTSVEPLTPPTPTYAMTMLAPTDIQESTLSHNKFVL